MDVTALEPCFWKADSVATDSVMSSWGFSINHALPCVNNGDIHLPRDLSSKTKSCRSDVPYVSSPKVIIKSILDR